MLGHRRTEGCCFHTFWLCKVGWIEVRNAGWPACACHLRGSSLPAGQVSACSVNPIPGGGFPAPLRFFLCHCQTPQDWQLILGDFFLIFIAQKNCQGQVRSPVAVCLPHLRKFAIPRARVFHGSISFLQVFIKTPLCPICISHNLYICDLRSGQIRVFTLQAYVWGKYWNALCFE